MLNNFDVEAIKDHFKHHPKSKIFNRGKDDKLPVINFYDNNIMWKAHIECRDDVYNQVADIARG